jgi:RNA polymerase sigma-70 factor (ECF subfamily)
MTAFASFGTLYDEHVDFVWRTVRRLGVPAGNDEDAVQDVFLTVHRKLGDFEGRSSMKTWLFGIAQSVVRNHRRTARRKRTDAASVSSVTPDELPGELLSDPFAHAAEQEALVWVQGFLDRLDEDKRAVFVLAELEEMPAPEIAEAVGANVNTVYSRLRAARAELGSALSRQAVQARHKGSDDAPPEDSRSRMRALLFAKLAAGPGTGLTVASLASAPAAKTVSLASAALLLAVLGGADRRSRR